MNFKKFLDKNLPQYETDVSTKDLEYLCELYKEYGMLVRLEAISLINMLSSDSNSVDFDYRLDFEEKSKKRVEVQLELENAINNIKRNLNLDFNQGKTR